jgi:hypothetical protein
MKQALIIEIELPDFNSIVKHAKKHWSKYSQPKKGYDAFVADCARKQLKPIKRYPVDFTFHWYCKDKRKDKDNIAVGKKFILDGLIKAKIIPNDNWQYVGNFSDKFYVDKHNPRVEVVIR